VGGGGGSGLTRMLTTAEKTMQPSETPVIKRRGHLVRFVQRWWSLVGEDGLDAGVHNAADLVWPF
jgi:hypothetical protein